MEKEIADSLAQSLPGFLYRSSADARWIMHSLSPRVFELTGYTSDELIENTRASYGDLILPEDRTAAWKAIERSLADRSDFDVEYRIRRRDGEVRWFWQRGKAGNPSSLSGYVDDVTDRRSSFEKIRSEADALALVVDAMPGVFYVIDERGHFVRWNRRFLDITGATAEQMAAWPAVAVIREEDRDLIARRIQAVFEDGYADAHAFLLTSDGPAPYYFTGQKIQMDDRPRLVGLGIDISERHRAEEALRRANEDLHAMNRIVHRCLLASTLSDLVNTFLENLMAFVGVEGGSLYLRDEDGLLCLNAYRLRPVHPYREPEKKDPSVESERCFECPHNCPRLIYSGILPVDTKFEGLKFFASFPLLFRDECTGMLCLYSQDAKDISEARIPMIEAMTAQMGVLIENLKLAEEIRRHAENLELEIEQRTFELEVKNRDLQAFSYSVSHDLSTPLRAILGWSHTVVEDYGQSLSAEVIQKLQRIEEAGKRMAELISNLLRLSRLSSQPLLRRMIHDPAALFQKAWDDVRAVREAEVRHSSTAPTFQLQGLSPCFADPSLLSQALVNLLDNAYKYSTGAPMPRVEVSDESTEAETIYAIADNGIGFDMQFAERLFEPFQRLHAGSEYQGTGIGLSIVDRIVRMHGGRVWVKSEPGRGATFFIALPAHHAVQSDVEGFEKSGDENV